MRKSYLMNNNLARCLAGASLIAALAFSAYGVTSTLTKHATAEDFQKGQTHGTVIGSEGTVKLGSATAQQWAASDDDVWAVNKIVAAADGTAYAGTSPGGKILKYAAGKWTVIYPAEKPIDPNRPAAEPNQPADANAPVDANSVKPVADETPLNEQVYALAFDGSGKLLAGISGEKCRLMRFEKDKPVTVFEPNEAKYVFAMALDANKNIYLATGPKGKLYKIAPDGKGKVLYTCTEKNLLSLAIAKDGSIFAGTDDKGRVYKVNSESGAASVMYDAEESEVAALALDTNGDLYAAISSEQAIKTTGGSPATVTSTPSSRAPLQSARGQSTSREVRMAHMPAQESAAAADKAQAKPSRPARSGPPSVVYKISREGYVTRVFSQPVAFFDMALKDGRLIIGTGNTAQLFAVNLKTEEQSELFAEKKASQITTVCQAGEDILVGTANTARIIKIMNKYAAEATYDSPLVDATQPANWGKLHIEASIPEGTSLMMSARSGNVSEVNDPTFSPWTKAVPVDEPVNLGCPVGRFAQYRLTFRSDGKDTPVVREVALASVVGNLAPVVDSVMAGPAPSSPLPAAIIPSSVKGREGIFKVAIKAHDDNKDALTYKIEMRKLGRQKWILVEDDLEKADYDWNTKTVEDGRYELRATVSDKKSNTVATALEGQRTSEPVVVDNTPPHVTEAALNMDTKAKTLTLKFRASDELSIIAAAEYAVDSSREWNGTLPDDMVFDQQDESFTILAKGLAAGEHVIAAKLTDAAGNTMYKTWDFSIEGK
jgi:outer membrane protein assembly factor BamB